MSAMKRWYEQHLDELTDEELVEIFGWDAEWIKFMRDAFTPGWDKKES